MGLFRLLFLSFILGFLVCLQDSFLLFLVLLGLLADALLHGLVLLGYLLGGFLHIVVKGYLRGDIGQNGGAREYLQRHDVGGDV